MYKRKFIDYLFLFIKGIAMGTANKVPGVSGGMVALVTGFYEEQIYSFQKFNNKALKLLSKRKFKSFYQYVNGSFLLAVFSGSFTAYFTISLMLDYLIVHYELMVWSVFFGMVVGSVYYVAKKIKNYNIQTYIIIIIGSILGLWVSFLDPLPPNPSFGFVFFCGMISVSGMTLPGFSGSFLLIILGNYVLLMVDAVNNFAYILVHILEGDFSFMHEDERMKLVYLILIFTFGALVGMIIFSKAVGYMIQRFNDSVLAAIMGFIIGSLGATWPWKTAIFQKDISGNFTHDMSGEKIIETYNRFIPNHFNIEFWMAILMIFIGYIIIWLIYYFENKRNLQKVKK